MTRTASHVPARWSVGALHLLLLLLPAQALLADSLRYGLDAEFVHDTNATRGPGGADSRPDTILAAEGSVTRAMLLGPHSGLVLRGAARYSQFLDFKDISNLALTGRAAWRYQGDRSFGAPWIELAGQAQSLSHADSRLRDGTSLSASMSVGSYPTDRVRVSAGAGVDKRFGDSTRLYDLGTNRLSGAFDYRAGLRNTLYARVTRVAGDHVFNAVSPAWQGLLARYSDRVVADPALGAGFIGYRIEATTWLYDVGYNYALPGGNALDFSLTYYSSRADPGGFKYDGAQLRASYLYRFQ